MTKFIYLFVLIVKEKKLKEVKPLNFYSEKIKYYVYYKYTSRNHDIKCFPCKWFYGNSVT